MALYNVTLSPAARKGLNSLPDKEVQRITGRLLDLEKNPRPSDVKKLKGYNNRWRIRVGNYRVIYTIENARLVILVIRIGHRRNVYE